MASTGRDLKMKLLQPETSQVQCAESFPLMLLSTGLNLKYLSDFFNFIKAQPLEVIPTEQIGYNM